MIAVVHLWSVIEEECGESWATIGWSLWDEGARLWLPSFCCLSSCHTKAGDVDVGRYNVLFCSFLFSVSLCPWASFLHSPSPPTFGANYGTY